ncbi:hypothetical protein M1247_35115 [Mycobacterium sp. 21AC1]|uniref:hypothetical protein n=1 Tax=[Mycobacterium] appelbergii TaxID=2939269 RepID=UPI0029392563|nr:hypothetical protein [Mycobacterium sp. 21AC1]MDV3130179.1 hypothetical protein [Mycobacterium sp. 21AC1]
MLSAREKILVEGQHDWVKLWEVHRHVAEENLSASLDQVQRKTLSLVRLLVTEGVAEVGDLRDHGARFEPWNSSVEESIRRISAEYVDRFDDRAGWPWTLWLRITDEAKVLGRSYQPAYELWLRELRERGREDSPLPLSLEPGGVTNEV